MNTVNQNPNAHRQDDGSPNQVDDLLRSYFCSEMPQPWPAFAGLKIEDRVLRMEDRESRIEDGGSSLENRGLVVAIQRSTNDTTQDDIVDPPSSIFKPRSSSFDPPSSNLHPRSSSILHPRSSTRSRVVLAASVAILLIGSWWIGQRFSMSQSVISPSSSGKMIGVKNLPGKNKSPRPQPALPVR